jgi:hypothetical protein
MGFMQLVDYVWVFFLVCGIPIMIVWMVVMNKALDQVSHDLRRMEPNAVWLCLIPLFGFVWQFLVAGAVAEGIAKELLARNMYPKEDKPGYGYALSGCILVCCCIIPFVGVCVAVIGLILLVVHMIKIAEYNSILKQSGRWETRYNARMEAIRAQMGQTWQQNNPYPSYQTPPVYNQQLPFQNTPPYQPDYTRPPQPNYIPPPQSFPQYVPPPDPPKYKGKDKPENPFG